MSYFVNIKTNERSFYLMRFVASDMAVDRLSPDVIVGRKPDLRMCFIAGLILYNNSNRYFEHRILGLWEIERVVLNRQIFPSVCFMRVMELTDRFLFDVSCSRLKEAVNYISI